MREINIYDDKVLINDSQDEKELIFERIVKYMEDNNCFSGESLHQDDECLISAPDVLSDIIDDILKPKYK